MLSHSHKYTLLLRHFQGIDGIFIQKRNICVKEVYCLSISDSALLTASSSLKSCAIRSLQPHSNCSSSVSHLYCLFYVTFPFIRSIPHNTARKMYDFYYTNSE